MMIDLTKFTPTFKTEFAQLARDRKEDFEALRKQGRWTASVYLGPYIVEARLKFKVCEVLKLERLPLVLKTHNLFALIIFAGLFNELEASPFLYDNFKKIAEIHKEVIYRYQVADSSHQTASDNLNNWLFNPNNGVMTWLGL